ncbi:MAG: acyl carrier protein [Betaproteobacteria bacterium]|nr:acyl carrier protein [Betaproteobacteria bacterium]
MTPHDIILEEIKSLLARKGSATDITPQTALVGPGGLLDSLDLATLVSALDMRLNFDPFAESIPQFSTVADLVALYPAQA